MKQNKNLQIFPYLEFIQHEKDQSFKLFKFIAFIDAIAGDEYTINPMLFFVDFVINNPVKGCNLITVEMG